MSKHCHWKPVQVPGHTGHLPGGCRKCWKPCRNTVQDGEHCADCYQKLALHPNPTVRRLIAENPDTPQQWLELLATDLNATVATAAAHNLPEPDPITSPTLQEWAHEDW